MVRKRELLMERCSPEEMEAMAATAPAVGGSPRAAAALGGGGPLAPLSSLILVQQ